MVSDKQVRRLMSKLRDGASQSKAADAAGMDRETARKYVSLGRRPSECSRERNWRTRTDPFEDVWPELRGMLELNSGLQALTLFQYVQREHPGEFEDGQLRTLQRRVKEWRATAGPGKEVYFPQVHQPGCLCASDFTYMGPLNVTIDGRRFDHLYYHFVLTYSNWETGMVCFSESFESLNEGLQSALWELGGVPAEHRTDCMTAAVREVRREKRHGEGTSPEAAFTERYRALLSYYGLVPQRVQPGHGNENGDIEQRHNRFKQAVDQSLMLRGSRDFSSREEYCLFLRKLVRGLNANRSARLQEEVGALKPLPLRRLDATRRLTARVAPWSTIHVDGNVYSVPSRLIGERVEVRVGAETLTVWYGRQQVGSLPRLRGKRRHRIDYRHVIDWLVRKPGAFANYRYQADLFPTSRFRIAYDALLSWVPGRADKEYLRILHLAATEGEAAVDDALRFLVALEQPITSGSVEEIIQAETRVVPPTEIAISPIDLASYDALLRPPPETAP